MDPLALLVKICDNAYKHDFFQLKPTGLSRDSTGTRRPKLRKKFKRLDSYLVHYLVKELGLSRVYRTGFLRTFHRSAGADFKLLKLVLLPTQKDLIDYNWNDRVSHMIRERCELDHALSWLSTLGGAFSALGDYFSNCALIAGKISVHQLQLALRLDDPTIVTRCRLYFSLSLIQQQHFELARRIILEEYAKAKSATVVDGRLVNMCRGIWAKLQYEYALSTRRRRKRRTRRLHKM